MAMSTEYRSEFETFTGNVPIWVWKSRVSSIGQYLNPFAGNGDVSILAAMYPSLIFTGEGYSTVVQKYFHALYLFSNDIKVTLTIFKYISFYLYVTC